MSSSVYVIQNSSKDEIQVADEKMKELPPPPFYLYYDAEQSSFEEVASTVSNKDEPTMRCLTIRSCLLGLVYVLGMSFLHQWTIVAAYRFYIGPALVIISAHVIGRLPSIFKRKPFTIKEDAVVLIMSNVAWSFNNQFQYATLGLIRELEIDNIKYIYIFFLVVALQFLGFSYAGILRRFLVWPLRQIWPSNIPWIALLRTLHSKQPSLSTQIYGTKQRSSWWTLIDNQKYFFYTCTVLQFIYCWFPQYIMRVLGAFSWMCMIQPSNFLLSQLTGFRGLGVGSFSFDWQWITNFVGSPLVVPRWALLNIAVGSVVVTWILTPILYFSDTWQCKEQSIGYFPFVGLTATTTFAWSALGIATTATAFASLTAVLVHMFLYEGKELWTQLRTKSLAKKGNDMHCRLISAYADVPDWWFGLISLVALAVLIIIGEVSQILRWYFTFLALVIPLIFTLPMGLVLSITGQIVQNPAVYYLCIVVSSSLLWETNESSKSTLFTTIAYVTFCQTLYLVSDMKLAHYMKIPPRTLFFIQSLACLVCSMFSIGIEYHYKETIGVSNPLRLGQLLKAFDFSEVAVFGDNHFFADGSRYRAFLWIMLGGAILPVPFWLARHRWSWCRKVHIPLILIFVSWMPAVPTGLIFTWIVIGLLTSVLFWKLYWKRHIFLVSAAMDVGLNIMILVAATALWNRLISFPIWWGTGGTNRDGCPLSMNGTVGNWFFLSLTDTPQ